MVTLICNGNKLYSYSSEWFPKVNVGETLIFEEAYPEITVARGTYTVDSIRHVFTKRRSSTNLETIIELKANGNTSK